MMAINVKLNKLRNTEINNNEELKEYLGTLRSILFELYVDISFTAEVLKQDISSIKGVKNTLRAKIIAGALLKCAELCKFAAGQSAATWRLFEQRFAAELAAAEPKEKRERFKIV